MKHTQQTDPVLGVVTPSKVSSLESTPRTLKNQWDMVQVLSLSRFSPPSWLSFCITFTLIVPLFFIVSGCEEDAAQKTTQTRGLPSHLRRKSSNKSQGAKKKGGVSQGAKPGEPPLIIPRRLKRKELLNSSGWANTNQIRGDIKGGRDPFWPDIPELKDQEEIQVDPSSIQRNLIVKVPQLSQTLTFKGSMTGLEVNLAMLEDSLGKGYTVRVGDIIGKNPEYVRVKLITSNEILFEPVLGVPQNELADSPRLMKKLRETDDENTPKVLGAR